MRARFGWVGVAVVLSSGVGVVAALVESPAPSSSAAAIARPVSTVVSRDVVTPQVRSLASEAQQLGQEIASAQGELTRLEHEVAYEATLSHYRLSALAPTAAVATSPRVRSREGRNATPATTSTEGAVTSTSVTTTSEPSTTISTTTAPPSTTPCATSYEDAAPASGAGCPTGVSYDN